MCLLTAFKEKHTFSCGSCISKKAAMGSVCLQANLHALCPLRIPPTGISSYPVQRHKWWSDHSVFSGRLVTLFSSRGCKTMAGEEACSTCFPFKKNVCSLPPSPIPPKCWGASYAKWGEAKCVQNESCDITWFRLLQIQTVVVHNLGCIRDIQPQKKSFLPQDKSGTSI